MMMVFREQYASECKRDQGSCEKIKAIIIWNDVANDVRKDKKSCDQTDGESRISCRTAAR